MDHVAGRQHPHPRPQIHLQPALDVHPDREALEGALAGQLDANGAADGRAGCDVRRPQARSPLGAVSRRLLDLLRRTGA